MLHGAEVLLLILAALASPHAFADDAPEERPDIVEARKASCTEVDLTKNGPFEHIPAMSQGDMGHCWAFAAAQAIDAYRFANGDKNYDLRTSPTAAAFGLKNWGGSGLWGPCSVIRHVKEEGLCSYYDFFPGTYHFDYLQKEFKAIAERYHEEAKKAGWRPENRLIRGIHALGGGSPWDDLRDQTAGRLTEILTRQWNGAGACVGDHPVRPDYVEQPQASDLARLLDSETWNTRLFMDILSNLCKKKIPLEDLVKPPPGCNLQPNPFDSQIYAAADRNLRKKLPVILSVDLDGPFSYDATKRKRVGGSADHFVLIVGSHWDETRHQCRFLIRNSWGASWGAPSKDCSEGSCWMDEDRVYSITQDYVTLEEQH